MRTLIEGLKFLWIFRKGSRIYWLWRLGTVYGSFYRIPLVKAGQLRPLRELMKDAWEDRENGARFLKWRPTMLR